MVGIGEGEGGFGLGNDGVCDWWVGWGLCLIGTRVVCFGHVFLFYSGEVQSFSL